jgi:hypothetical protein
VKIALALLSVALSTVAQAQVHCTVGAKRISIKAPTVFTGTLEDAKDTPIATKKVALTSLDLDKAKKTPKISQATVTDSRGAFHFDSVPAGKYTIAIGSGWAVRKAEVNCTPDNSCRVALVVRSFSTEDCYNPRSDSDLLGNGDGSVIRQ